jgi:hypothetical protein
LPIFPTILYLPSFWGSAAMDRPSLARDSGYGVVDKLLTYKLITS